MSPMEQLLLGKPFTAADSSPPDVKAAHAAIPEIEGTGAVITRIHHDGSETPLKFFIRFPEGKPQVETRLALEKLGYDVGQKLQLAALAFYVTKRTTKSKGWEV